MAFVAVTHTEHWVAIASLWRSYFGGPSYCTKPSMPFYSISAVCPSSTHSSSGTYCLRLLSLGFFVFTLTLGSRPCSK